MRVQRKILSTYELGQFRRKPESRLHDNVRKIKVPKKHEKLYRKAIIQEQPYLLERLWYHAGDDQSKLAVDMLQVMQHMNNKHQIEQLATDYEFTGSR